MLSASLSITPRVCSSDDDCDNPAFNPQADEAYGRRQLAALKQDDRVQDKQEKLSEENRARMAARQREIRLREEGGLSQVDAVWDKNRALDLQDFEYLFQHRNRLPSEICTWIEIVASKISHIHDNGEDSYFKELEQNVGWTDYITPIIFSGASLTDNLVRCGIWAHAKNSRRCHKPNFCPLCHWIDILKVLVEAFGEASGAFNRAPAWWFITIGWTTNLRNAKCVSGDFDPDDCKPSPVGDRGYEPYPVRLGRADDDSDEAWRGYQDARILGLVMQEAIGELYQQKIVDGYHNKIEGSYRLNADRPHYKSPIGANRVHLHCHAVGNGRETNGQFIAETLLQHVHKSLMKYRHRLHRRYYPDIQVKRIRNSEHLEKAIVYGEKVVPVSLMVADAMSRSEAKLPDESWNPLYMHNLNMSLHQLIEDDIPTIFTGYRLDPDLPKLFRRKTAGNMTFSDRGTCIGVEPHWHTKLRRKKAKELKAARESKKERNQAREDYLCKRGKAAPPPKKYKRRSRPRHLRRSLGIPSVPKNAPAGQPEAVDGHRPEDSS